MNPRQWNPTQCGLVRAAVLAAAVLAVMLAAESPACAQAQATIKFDGMVQSMAFSADGKTLVASVALEVSGWDTQTGKEAWKRETLGAGGEPFPMVSPDGSVLAAQEMAGFAEAIALCEMQSGRLLRNLPAGLAGVRGAAFSPDGKTLLVASFDGTAWLWDVSSGKRRALQGLGNDAIGFLFSPDAGTLAVSRTQAIDLWDAATGKRKALVKVPGGVEAMAISPDGKTLAAGSGAAIGLYDTATGKASRTLRAATATSLGFTADSKTLLAFYADGDQAIVSSWDLQSPDGPALAPRTFARQDVRAAAFSREAMCLATAGPDGGIRLWDVREGKPMGALKGLAGRSPAPALPSAGLGSPGVGSFGLGGGLVFSPDGKLLALCYIDGTVAVFDVEKAAPPPPETAPAPEATPPQPGPPQPAMRLWRSADGRFSVEAALVGQADGRVTLKRKDGGQIEVALDRLSQEDRDFVKQAAQAPAGAKVGEKEALAALRKLGARVSTKGDHATQVDLSGTPATDADLALLESLEHLESLNLADTKITDAGLAHLAGLGGLTALDLTDTQVTDAGMEHLLKLGKLGSLTLTGTEVGDAGLTALRRLPRLRVRHEAKTWACNHVAAGDRSAIDMTGVAVVFEGIPAPAGPAFGQIQIGGPGGASGSGVSQCGTVRVQTHQYVSNGVTTLEIKGPDQKYVLQFKKAGKLLVINEKQTFDLSGGKKTIVVGRDGMAKEMKR